jgi:hypothetical protein
MLILDKSRALDLMVAYATQVHVPDELSFGWRQEQPAPERRPFRVATYGPLEHSESLAARPDARVPWLPLPTTA